MNWAALQQAGIDPDTPVTISAQSVLFGVLVSKILAGTGLSCSADNRLLHLVASADRKSPMSAARKPARFWPRAASPVEQLIEMPLPEDLQPPRDDSLSDILQTVSNITGAKMSIDWGAIKQAGVSPDTSVTVNTANVTAGDMLALALRNAKPGAELQFMPRGDTIAISTRQAFDLRDRPKKLLFWGAASCCVSMICILAYRRRRNRYLPKALFFSLIVASSLMAACLTARIAFAVQPIEGVAFGQRWTLNPGRAGPSLWMTPADPMTPYLKNGPDSAFIDRFVRAGPQTQDWKYASVEVHHTGWPYEIWRIEWPNGSGVLLTSLLPIAWLIARTRKYWRQPNVGMCPRCGYDLRASSDYCPECGSAIEENTTISRA